MVQNRRKDNSPGVEIAANLLEFVAVNGELMVSIGADLSQLSEAEFVSKYGVDKFDVESRATLLEYLISRTKQTTPVEHSVLARLSSEVDWFSNLIHTTATRTPVAAGASL